MPFDTIRLGSSAAGDYEIERSLRFHSGDSTVLTQDLGTSGTNRKKTTISFWYKPSALGGGIIHGGVSGTGGSATGSRIYHQSTGKLYIQTAVNNSSVWAIETTRALRDFSAWYHIVLQVDTTQGTDTNRVKLYINGEQETAFDSASYPTQDYDDYWVYGKFRIGDYGGDYGYYYGMYGYLAEVHVIDGTAALFSDFAQTDVATGQWNPKKYGGSYGTNGFYCNFSDNSGVTTTTLGKDSSGNSNNFTCNNFSVTAGTGNDSFEDTPSNNFPTFNPVNAVKYNGNYSPIVEQGNLLMRGADNHVNTTFLLPRSGKWYFECSKYGDGATQDVGITDATADLRDFDGALGAAKKVAYLANGENCNRARGDTSDATAWTSDADALIGCAVDMDNGAVYFAHDNTWQDSGDPTSGSSKTGAFATDLLTYGSKDHVPSCAGANGNDTKGMWINFGQRPFTYTPPTGYQKLCSKNLPEPAIIKSNKHFDTKLYTGTGSSQTITGLEFSPGKTLIKKRNAAEDWEAQDSLRGATKRLIFNDDAGEGTVAGSISAFTSDGFTVVDAGMTNENTHTYASFHWKAGSSAANTAGTINSTVSVNADAGISIVKYTGNGTAGATVGHGLGVAVESIWIKALDLAGKHWSWGSTRRGWTHWYKMSGGAAGTGGSIDEADMYNDTAPTSTVFSLGNDLRVNNSGTDYVAYCFSSVSGFSKVGSYVGNGSADGTFVHTGFTPKWIYFTGGGHRLIKYKDNTQQIGNPIGFNFLGSYNNAAEDVAGWDMDMLSNGFKFRGTDTSSNENTTTHYYVAFAESPFKYNRAQ